MGQRGDNEKPEALCKSYTVGKSYTVAGRSRARVGEGRRAFRLALVLVYGTGFACDLLPIGGGSAHI